MRAMVLYRYYQSKTQPVENYLPDRIRKYLNDRGLPDQILEAHSISWDGERIVIPIFDRDGIWLFNKYRRDPESNVGPKYTYDKGSTSALYNLQRALSSERVIICEGEFDVLILEANGFTAVSSTGGAGTFRKEWTPDFAGKEMFVCYDADPAGEKGAYKVTQVMPSIKNIPLPTEIGDHGDITDFFIKLGKTKKDFEILMSVSFPIELPEEPRRVVHTPRKGDGTRIVRAKEVPLDRILAFNSRKFAKCPFHNENTASLHWHGENKWYCFGCGERGDGIDLVMKIQSIGFKEAVEFLNGL